jgi:hypothetical protein
MHALAAKERLREELRRYFVVSAYLFVCFAVLMLYRSAVLHDSGQHVAATGTALVKALVLGKFLLIGEAAGIGTRVRSSTLLRRIGSRTVLLTALLIALTILEEVAVGLVHHISPVAALAEFFGDALLEKLAGILVMLLVLLPLVAVTELRRAMGPSAWSRLLRSPADGPS